MISTRQVSQTMWVYNLLPAIGVTQPDPVTTPAEAVDYLLKVTSATGPTSPVTTGPPVVSRRSRIVGVLATPAGHGALTATVHPKISGALAGHGATAPGPYPKIGGHGALTATVPAKFAATAPIAGRGALTGIAHITKATFTAPTAGSGALTAAVVPKIPAPITGHGAFKSGNDAGALGGQGALTATAALYSTHIAAAPTGHGALTSRGAIGVFIPRL